MLSAKKVHTALNLCSVFLTSWTFRFSSTLGLCVAFIITVILLSRSKVISSVLRQATVCGGGRCDCLVQQLGGPPTPAVDWALGMQRLMLVLEAAASADAAGPASRFRSAKAY